jgi:hypothetical protein
MKKSFIYTMLLTVGVMLGITACSSDNNWQPGSVSGQQVFFSNNLGSSYEISPTENSFSVQVSRYDKSGALNVPLTVTMNEGSIFNVPTSVSFADGQDVANLVISYNPADIVYGKYDTITVALNDAAVTTPYGISTYKFTAGVTEWVKLKGSGLYRDDFIGSLWNVGNQVWDVDIYESAITPGRYKVATPYSPDYGFRKSKLWSNEEEILEYWKNTGNCDMIIDATDPDFVYFQYFDSGLLDLPDEGMLGMTSYVWYWLRNGNDLESIKAARPSYFGKLKDNVITFETPKSLLMTMNGENELKWYGNANGMLAIALPGGVFSDYSASVVYEGIFTNPAGEVFAMGSLKLGPDATNVKGIVMPGNVDANAVADAIAAGELEAADVAAGSFQLPISEEMSGKLQIIIAVIDGEDVKTVATAEFEYYGGGANPWKSLGQGYFVDDMILPLFSYDPEPYPVDIEESTSTPGLYRLVKMYSAVAADFGVVSGTGDVLVHAENPNGVYIPLQPLELTLGSNGPFSLSTDAGELVEEYGFDAVYAQLPNIFGKLADGVITFPVLEGENSAGNPVNYQTWVYLGEKAYFGGRNGAFQIVLPGVQAQSMKRAADFSRRLNGAKLKNAVKPSKKVLKNKSIKLNLVK